MQRTEKQKIGHTGEEIATRFLIKNGYLIKSRNVRIGNFEVDILAEKQQVPIIFEIKCVAREMIVPNDISREMFAASGNYDRAKQFNIHTAAEKMGIERVYLMCVALSVSDGKAYVNIFDA